MQDRLNKDVKVGDAVSIVGHDTRWIIVGFNDWRCIVEAILENPSTKEIKWMPLLDIELI